MCSSTFGPAITPSLLMWPTMKTVTPLLLQYCIRRIVQSLTCVTEPGEACLSSVKSVWTESTISTSGFSPSAEVRTSSRFVSQRKNSSSPLTCSRSARSLS